MLERYNQEIKRRTHIVRVFPNTVNSRATMTL
jgi:transposase-like protein